MPKSWSKKDERKYEHIKESAEDRGKSEKRAEEIAARTVNRDRKEGTHEEVSDAAGRSLEREHALGEDRPGSLSSCLKKTKARSKRRTPLPGIERRSYRPRPQAEIGP